MPGKTSKVRQIRTAAKAVTPLALTAKQWWDGLSDKEKARYREHAARVVRQAREVGKAGLDRARTAKKR